MDDTKIIKNVSILLLLIVAGCNKPSQISQDKATGDIFKNEQLGLSISKPASWVFLTTAESLEGISLTKLEDKDMEQLVQLFYRPLVVMTKSQEQTTSPCVSITVNPYDSSREVSAMDILTHFSRIGPRTFKDYTIVKPPQEIVIDSHKAAYMEAHYTGSLYFDNNIYPTNYETWIIPQEGYFLMIGAVSLQNADDETRDEIASIIKSIKLK